MNYKPLIPNSRWYTMGHADGSVMQTFEYLKQNSLEGLKTIWPTPSLIAWKIIAVFGAFEAFLQLALPGKRFEGSVSPTGHVPVYKVGGSNLDFLDFVGSWT